MDDHQFFQLDAGCLRLAIGRRQPAAALIHFMPGARRRTVMPRSPPPVNAFFQGFYRDSANALAAM